MMNMGLTGYHLPLVLCLIIRKVYSQYPVDDDETVNGILNQPVSLNCIYLTPDNWDHKEVQVIWFKNFTVKLWDCIVKQEEAPLCQSSPFIDRSQLSNHIMDGNVSLEIHKLQASDAGPYQCWVMLSDFYKRQYLMLRVQDEPKDDLTIQYEARQSVNQLETNHLKSDLIMGGWLFTLLLSGFIFYQNCCIRNKKRNYRIII
ncbi:butyrophilin subfamily 3 member A2 [Bombina bombina]|uniref:butyrophilin subfamily 3 member A2 n=1 Tax=Bombina bombina TaxID=8345 RepID=UPI00235B1F85|nr:butyrophilin subfamily 3 member A2 [Bombina bombina]